jgi:hypothetical protein
VEFASTDSRAAAGLDPDLDFSNSKLKSSLEPPITDSVHAFLLVSSSTFNVLSNGP